MSLTALAFLVAYFAGLLFSFYRPLLGLGVYILTFYANPASSWWGQDLPDLRWSMTAAVVTLIASLIVGRTRPETSSPTGKAPPVGGTLATPERMDTIAVLLSLLVGWIWIESVWAVDAQRHLNGAILMTKFLVLYLLVRRLVRTEQEFDFFAMMHVFGAFTWGWIGFRSDVQGRFEPMLGPGMNDANAIGFQMVVATAFAGFMFIGARGWTRWLAFGALPFLINTLILTASRSALLAMLVAGIAAVWLAPRERRRHVYVSAGLGVVLFLMLAGSNLFWERAATLSESNVAEMDASAASRLTIAQANWNMFLDRPLGAGYEGNYVLSPKYVPPELLSAEGFRSAHNTFLAVLVDAGTPGALIFLLLTLNAVLPAVKRSDAQRLSTKLGSYRAAVGASVCAFLVASQFINLLTAETWVWLFALVSVLKSASATARAPVLAESLPGPREQLSA